MRTQRSLLILALGALCATQPALAFAQSPGNILKQIDDAQDETNRRKAQGTDLGIDEVEDGGGGGGADPRYGSTGELSGCPGSAPGGRMSLLGVPSDMGPARRPGMRAVLDPRHPLWEEKKAKDEALEAADKKLSEEAKAAGFYLPQPTGAAPYALDWEKTIASAETSIAERAKHRATQVKELEARQEQLRKAETDNERQQAQRAIELETKELAEASAKLARAEEELSFFQRHQAKYESAMAPLLGASAATKKLIEEKQYPCP